MGLFSLIFVGILSYIGFLFMGVHKVNEGHVGIYKRFGVLQEGLTEPGLHLRYPFIQEFIEMKINVQTDTVTQIPCGTSNGTLVYFEKIQIVNKLKKKDVYQTVLNYSENYEKYWITDKIHSQINQFCSKHSLQQMYIDIFDTLDEELKKALQKDIAQWAPGIEILSVRVTKPIMPQRIKVNFQQMEKTKVDYYIATEKQNVKMQEQLTKQKQAVIAGQSKLIVKRIQFQKQIILKKNQLEMSKIEAQIILEKFKTETETQFMAAFAQAQLYPKLYTKDYLKYLAKDSYTSNATITIGDSIPNISFDKSLK